MHWTSHPKLLTRHAAEYKNALGSVFYGTHTFEMLALILLRDYDKLADRFVGQACHLPPAPTSALAALPHPTPPTLETSEGSDAARC